MTETLLPTSRIAEYASFLPPTMSMPLAKALEELGRENYRDTLTHLLDFFEMSVQWLNCHFLALACTAEGGGKLKGVERAVRIIDTKRPLSFGDSVNELFNPLLEAMQKCCPEHPLVRSLSTHLRTGKYDILTGSAKVQGVIKIRNDYKGHSTALSQSIYMEVVGQMGPKVDAMLSGLEPLRGMKVHTVLSSGEAVALRGGWGAPSGRAPADEESGHYYVESDAAPKLDLYPLVISRQDRYVYVFQTLKDEKVKYESSDENVHGFETEEYNRCFDAFMQRLSESFDIAKEANWNELQDMMREHSSAYMVQVQKEKKYSSELFVDRTHLSRMLERFSASAVTLMPLAGDAGQGKTNQICNWTERFLEQGLPVLTFSGASFADATLADTLKAVFNAGRRRPLGRVLDHLHSKAAEAGETVCFFFDAVNECLAYETAGEGGNAPEALFRDIVDSLIKEEYPRFKVITTCRSYTWKNHILPHVHLPEGLTFTETEGEEGAVVGFSDEETRLAYIKYGDLYQMSTPFESLDRRVMLRLRDPLVMKFVCSNYVGAALSPSTDDYSSIALFSKMIRDIGEKSFAGRKQCELLGELSRIFMLSYLHGVPAGSLTNSSLKQAYADEGNPLHRLSRLIYKDDGLTVAYTELRNKPDRPILRESEKTVGGGQVRSIEFIYERFLEYMMARAFIEMKTEGGGTIDAATYVEAFSGAAVNVVFMGAMRNSLIMEIIRTGDYSVLLGLISGCYDNPDIMQLVNEVLDTLIRENFEDTLFELVNAMLAVLPQKPESIAEYNRVQKEIAASKATSETIARHNALSAEIAPVVRLRNASNVAVNNMLLSDYFNEDLYRHPVLDLLWRLMGDDISDVGNEACKLAYYLTLRRYTHSHTPLRENLTKRIISEMYSDIKSRSLLANVASARARKKTATFIETATRLAVLLIIDATIAPEQDSAMIGEMLGEIRGVASYCTWRYRLVRVAMPFLQTVMRKQITFQSDYVNNAVEYQGFWDDAVVPAEAGPGQWSRRRLKDAMRFVGVYERYSRSSGSDAVRAEMEEFREFLPVARSAYLSGCSFSYFIMERIVIIAGCVDWNSVKDLFIGLLDPSMRDFEWFDYMQMSLLYDLYQLEVNSREYNYDILEMYTREARSWTLRCRGLFKARYSGKANPTGLYKRNVLNWYCVTYCCHSGDNVAHVGDAVPVPLLYELADMAVENCDRELLFHILDNVSELISDFGYVRTALGALKYIMEKYDSREAVARLDAAPCPGDRFAGETLVRRIGSVLSTAKTYFPSETDAFLRSDVIGLKFPGVESFSEDILNYHPGGEGLSDLFTHRFGNFLLWSLLHEKAVDDFSYEAVCAAVEARDCFAWFDNVIRILCRTMFGVKI